MRIIKSGLTLALLAMSLTQVHLALAAEPVACPLPEQIQQAGLSAADENKDVEDNQVKYVASQESQYATNSRWLFAVGNMDASSKADAIDQGNRVLMELSAIGDPIYNDTNHTWVCVYNAKDVLNHRSYMAVAVSPVPQGASVKNMFTII